MQLNFADWSHALALVESRDNPNVALGDNGRAAGRWQIHPSFYDTWREPVPFGQEPTWDDMFSLALKKFYDKAVADGIDDADAAVGFHLHGAPRAGSAAEDPAYAQAFRQAAGL
jgi:hypothetical protein